jgi:hypothetical protein
MDHDALAASQALEIDAMAHALHAQLDPAMDQAFAVHARAAAGLVDQSDSALLQDAGANAAEHMIAGVAFKNDAIAAGLMQQLAEQQPGGTGPDDCRLCALSHARSLAGRPVSRSGTARCGLLRAAVDAATGSSSVGLDSGPPADLRPQLVRTNSAMPVVSKPGRRRESCLRDARRSRLKPDDSPCHACRMRRSGRPTRRALR